ncbi:uncharacterized protein ARMOST_12792 [Armillaria ostoyae]|uniref:Uncharacterized protein n=1 Tax=Armillaria ostoyae TaxID=47428 RepID=A0A284RKZ4_ARMOS|nr:uncharacterized protein ARMOST_12792 [Armillaria ostoyae]
MLQAQRPLEKRSPSAPALFKVAVMRLSHNDGLAVQTRHDDISFPHSSPTWHLYCICFPLPEHSRRSLTLRDIQFLKACTWERSNAATGYPFDILQHMT